MQVGGNWDDAVLLIIGAARALNRAKSFLAAGHQWRRVSATSQRFSDFADFRALDNYSRAESPPTELMRRLVEAGALDHDFPNTAVTRLRARYHFDDAIGSHDIDAALAADRSGTCQWLHARDPNLDVTASGDSEAAYDSSPRSIQQYLWSECIGLDSVESTADPPDSPSVGARLRRANRLFDLVRYDDALDAIAPVSLDEVDSAHLRCRLQFRLARTRERRDQTTTAANHYKSVIDDCGDGTAPDAHIRSLYALGDHHFDRKHFDRSTEAFQSLLDNYPQRSHADDALLYLGRIARERGNDERAFDLLRRALEDYPSGDMIFEFAWESLEPLVRDKQWNEFLTELDDLDLPQHDEQPYSQGRLGYFRARAHRALDRPEAAAEAWAATWRRYPFSFYGYLSRMHLGPDDDVSTDLMPDNPAPANWFAGTDDSASPTTGTRLLTGAGFTRLALAYERGTQPEARGPDLWRRAALWHDLGEFHHSHNIPRLAIDERPWVEPAAGRLARWSVAYPDPHRAKIVRALFDETRHHADASVQPALVTALMREESAFLTDVESWAGALGLMQLMPATARDHQTVIEGEADRKTLLTAWPNIRIGVDHLFMLAEQFSSHPVKMIAAYNAGGGAVRSWPAGHTDIALWVEDIPFRQTRHYVKRVIGSYAAYQWLAGRPLDPRIALMP